MMGNAGFRWENACSMMANAGFMMGNDCFYGGK